MARYIDADALENEGWSLHRTYQKDKATMVYEVKAISEINTAQPDVPDTNVGDMISRRAAIDALGEEPEVWSGNDEYAQGLNNQWNYDVNALKELPAAQPERKQMEIEYTAWNEEIYGKSAICGNCGCTWQIANNGNDNFCPNCGAQMIQEG